MWPFKKKSYVPSTDWEDMAKELHDRIQKEHGQIRKDLELTKETSQYTCHECQHIAAKPAAKTVKVIDRRQNWADTLYYTAMINSYTGVKTEPIRTEDWKFCKLCVPLYDTAILNDSNHPIKYSRVIDCDEEGKLFGIENIEYYEAGTLGGKSAR